MDSGDITSMLTADPQCAVIFKGVFSRDEFVRAIPSFFRQRFVCVFNTHAKPLPGEHWIAFAGDGKKCYYMDSFGMSPAHYPDVYHIFSRLPQQIKWNSTCLQGVSSTACGDYCVLFSLLFARGWTMSRFVARLDCVSDAEQRDHSVRRAVIMLYGPKAHSSLRNTRPGLSGKDRLHVDFVTKALGVRCSK